MKNRVIASLLAGVMVLAVHAPAFAAAQGLEKVPASGMHVMFTNADSVESSLNFSGEQANCLGIVEGKAGTTKITATILLKRIEGNEATTVKVWSASALGDALYFDKTYYVAGGYTYQLELDADVFRNGTAEFVSASAYAYCG
mgnify:FL=1